VKYGLRNIVFNTFSPLARERKNFFRSFLSLNLRFEHFLTFFSETQEESLSLKTCVNCNHLNLITMHATGEVRLLRMVYFSNIIVFLK
jgi:hypothetical protein